MVLKLSVLRALVDLIASKHPEVVAKTPGGSSDPVASFWHVLLAVIEPKDYNSVSEYELYFNYALDYHPDTIKLRHLTFANGPRPGMVYTKGDEGHMLGPVWQPGRLEKQMALDQRAGFDYVGYHDCEG